MNPIRPPRVIDYYITANFRAKEFACKHCGQLGIDTRLVAALQQLRDRMGIPLLVTSGYRCVDHPIEAAKPTPGYHARGLAADVTAAPWEAIYSHARLMDEFGGIGVNRHQKYVHLDIRPGARKYWAYDARGVVVPWDGDWGKLG